MTFEDFWPAEERLWMGGAQVYARALHPGCLMAFAGVGPMDAAAARKSIEEAPRWNSITPGDGRLSRISDDIIVLAYRAEAGRKGEPPYRCVCTSTYSRQQGDWLLVQHQQSAE